MLTKGIIERSSSPWASPVVLVRKKDNTWCFCVDYWYLNKIAKKDAYPPTRIGGALDCFHGATEFSSIDLRSGYWQIAVDSLDRENTALVTPYGLYQFKVMSFGLYNVSATIEQITDTLLHSLKGTDNQFLWYLLLSVQMKTYPFRVPNHPVVTLKTPPNI